MGAQAVQLAAAWSYEDGPESHPLWEQQVNLERLMLKGGADKFRDHVIVAKRREQATRIRPLRGLLHDWLPVVVEGLREWLRGVEGSRGPRPIAYPLLKDADHYAASLIAIREVLDGIGHSKRGLTRLAIEIGRTLEHEVKIRKWEAASPDLFHHYREELDRRKTTNQHRRRVNINRYNALTADGAFTVDHVDWSLEQMFRVGAAMLDIIIRYTGWFEIQQDPEYRASRGKAYAVPLVLATKPGLNEWLAKALDATELNSPDFKPTIMPPRRWDGTRDGGYWTPYVKAPRLVRFKASQEHQKERAADEYDALDFPMVYDALHLLQETPWRVNRRVLDVAKKAWALDREIAGLPKIGEIPLPPRTPRMEEHRERLREAKINGWQKPEPDPETDREIRHWKRQAHPIYRANARRVSHMKAASATILTADEYAQYDRFYFPHMLDFRGRMYPIPNFLQPQGADLAKGLLEFADGMPVTEESGGAGWLAIQVASAWGNDKVPFDQRIDWVESNEDLWRRIALDPLANLEWAEDADKPWQALAAIFDWVGFLDAGFGYVSRLPVMVDGTCNGIQHLSALTRDRVAGYYVNLVPSEQPQDIYKFVAGQLQEDLERIEKAGGPEGEKATYWLDLTARNLPRTLTKRQVMVLPYGGTRESFFDYTREWLDAHDPMPTPAEGEEDEAFVERLKVRTGRIAFMGAHMWYRVGKVVSGGTRVMQWLQDCAKAAALEDQPIYWVVPSGFVVRHFYGTLRLRRMHLLLDGDTYALQIGERTAKLSVQDQLRGIAPNFIHSLDASALVACLNKCRMAGITTFSAVHDAFGTHAASMWPLARMLREGFVEVHEHDLLGGFRSACQRTLVAALVERHGMDPLEASEKADELLPPPLDLGDLSLRDVLQSDYFFA